MRGASAAANGATASMEQTKMNVEVFCSFVECSLSLVEFPRAREHSSVFVRVGIGQHDLLPAMPSFQKPRIIQITPQGCTDRAALPQVFDGFEQWHRHDACQVDSAKLRQPEKRKNVIRAGRAADDV